MSKKIYILIGTRPNFIKVTQFKKVAEKTDPSIDISIIHTGQHYDQNMAMVFFDQFDLRPDYFLNIGQGTPLSQISNIQLKLESLFEKIGEPDILVVPGDVNSTLAGAITANKMGIKLAHLEAGLRSCDRTMPEEFNRLLTDELSDVLFVTEKSGTENLKNEKKSGEIVFVGNTMIDTMVAFEEKIDESNALTDYNLSEESFVVVTVHRPSNVDNQKKLTELLKVLADVSEKFKVVFPVHPRTQKNIEQFGLTEEFSKIDLINPGPLGYFEFQKLVKECAFVITDSGGIQEETTFRKVPCITIRDNTERPITSEIGTNTLLALDANMILPVIDQIVAGTYKKGSIPELWDGKATDRILKYLVEIL